MWPALGKNSPNRLCCRRTATQSDTWLSEKDTLLLSFAIHSPNPNPTNHIVSTIISSHHHILISISHFCCSVNYFPHGRAPTVRRARVAGDEPNAPVHYTLLLQPQSVAVSNDDDPTRRSARSVGPRGSGSSYSHETTTRTTTNRDCNPFWQIIALRGWLGNPPSDRRRYHFPHFSTAFLSVLCRRRCPWRSTHTAVCTGYRARDDTIYGDGNGGARPGGRQD